MGKEEKLVEVGDKLMVIGDVGFEWRNVPVREVVVTKVQVFRIVAVDTKKREEVFKRKRGTNLPFSLKHSTPELYVEQQAIRLKQKFMYKDSEFWKTLDVKVLEEVAQVFKDHKVAW